MAHFSSFLLLASVVVAAAVLFSWLGNGFKPGSFAPLPPRTCRLAVQWARSTGLQVPNGPNPAWFIAAAVALAVFIGYSSLPTGEGPNPYLSLALLVVTAIPTRVWFKGKQAYNRNLTKLMARWVEAGRPDPLPPTS